METRNKPIFVIEKLSYGIWNKKDIFVHQNPKKPQFVYFSFDGMTPICQHSTSKKDLIKTFKNHENGRQLCSHVDCSKNGHKIFHLIGNHYLDNISDNSQTIKYVLLPILIENESYRSILYLIINKLAHPSDFARHFFDTFFKKFTSEYKKLTDLTELKKLFTLMNEKQAKIQRMIEYLHRTIFESDNSLMTVVAETINASNISNSDAIARVIDTITDHINSLLDVLKEHKLAIERAHAWFNERTRVEFSKIGPMHYDIASQNWHDMYFASLTIFGEVAEMITRDYYRVSMLKKDYNDFADIQVLYVGNAFNPKEHPIDEFLKHSKVLMFYKTNSSHLGIRFQSSDLALFRTTLVTAVTKICTALFGTIKDFPMVGMPDLIRDDFIKKSITSVFSEYKLVEDVNNKSEKVLYDISLLPETLLFFLDQADFSTERSDSIRFEYKIMLLAEIYFYMVHNLPISVQFGENKVEGFFVFKNHKESTLASFHKFFTVIAEKNRILAESQIYKNYFLQERRSFVVRNPFPRLPTWMRNIEKEAKEKVEPLSDLFSIPFVFDFDKTPYTYDTSTNEVMYYVFIGKKNAIVVTPNIEYHKKRFESNNQTNKKQKINQRKK